MGIMSEQASRPDQQPPGNAGNWDTGTHAAFYDYYRDQSLSPQTMERFERVRDLLLRLIGPDAAGRPLKVADIGCGAGSQAWLWAKLGHHVSGLDINQPLIELARTRSGGLAATTEFTVGSATALPWPNESMDVCLLPELLEHVADWEAVVQEAARVTKPRGYLYLSTTNKLCPVQQEFELPAYSWYPGFLKRHYERLAVTSRPELANYAKYPAVHWFTYFGLAKYLAPLGFRCMDRFDLMDMRGRGLALQAVRAAIRTVLPLRYLAHVATPYTVLIARKDYGSSS